MYKILTQIHFIITNFTKIMHKNIFIHGLSNCLAKRVKILGGFLLTLGRLQFLQKIGEIAVFAKIPKFKW